MPSFVLENVSVPAEVEAAIDKRSSMAAVGNLNDYVKFQMAQGIEKGGGGVGAVGAELGIGLGIAQQMMNQPGGIMAQTTPAAAGAPAPAGSGSAWRNTGHALRAPLTPQKRWAWPRVRR